METPAICDPTFLPFSVDSLWKWGALILAIMATLSRKRFLAIRRNNSLSSPPLPVCEDFSDDDDDVASSSSSTEDDPHSPREAFRANGLSRVFSWEDFHGASVVKLWDGLGRGLHVGSRRKTMTMTGICQSAVSLSTSANGVDTWDGRTRCRAPVMRGQWLQPTAEVSGMFRRGAEVYVKNVISGEVAVGDVRNIGKLVRKMPDSGSGVWWDADPVIEHSLSARVRSDVNNVMANLLDIDME